MDNGIGADSRGGTQLSWSGRVDLKHRSPGPELYNKPYSSSQLQRKFDSLIFLKFRSWLGIGHLRAREFRSVGSRRDPDIIGPSALILVYESRFFHPIGSLSG